MKLSKKFMISLIMISACAFTFAQTTKVQSTDTVEEVETSVESDYLNDMIAETISAMAKSEDLATKIEALDYLKNAVESGNTSPAIIDTIDQLAGEGITKQTRENGRLKNNFPQVRREACLILGKVPTVHSKNTLVQIAKEDLEPMVGAAAVQALGNIAKDIDCVDEAVNAISFFQKHNMYMNPTSSFAMEVLFAYEKLIDSSSPALKRQIIEDVADIYSNPNYHNGLVELKAREMLMEYSGMNKSSANKNNNVNEK